MPTNWRTFTQYARSVLLPLRSQGKPAGKIEQGPPEKAKTKCAPAGKHATVEPPHRRLRWISLSFEMRSKPADRHKARHAEKDSERKRIYEQTDGGRCRHQVWREPRHKKSGGYQPCPYNPSAGELQQIEGTVQLDRAQGEPCPKNDHHHGEAKGKHDLPHDLPPDVSTIAAKHTRFFRRPSGRSVFLTSISTGVITTYDGMVRSVG